MGGESCNFVVMVTTRVQLTAYVAEWVNRRYGDAWGLVRFPRSSDLYLLLYELMSKRPYNSPVDRGNVKIALPDRREANRSGGKSPEQFNYITQEATKTLDRRLTMMFWAEVHDNLDEARHRHGLQYKEAARLFIRRYRITGISEEGILKNYQRWRKKVRQHRHTSVI